MAGQRPGVFTETPDEMVRRVTRELGTKRNIVVINDEAHHCYRRRVGADEAELEALSGEDKREAAKRDGEAGCGSPASRRSPPRRAFGSSTTCRPRPSTCGGRAGRGGTLFQWVVSDFSLIDTMPTYRGLWLRIRDDLPEKGRKTAAVDGQEPALPGPLEGALHSLSGNYEKAFRRWEESAADLDGSTPPVFIVVCNNTSVSKMVFDYIAG